MLSMLKLTGLNDEAPTAPIVLEPAGGVQLILKPPLVVSAVTVGTLAAGALDVDGPCTKAGLPDAMVTLAAPVPRLIKPSDIDHMMAALVYKLYAMTVDENISALLFGSAMTLLVSGLLPLVVS